MDMLGGISKAIIAELIISAVVSSSSYPLNINLFLIGFPIATTVAWVEPDIAPKIVQVAAVVIAIPPCMCPTNVSTKSNNLFDVCPAHIISAAKINIGTDNKTIG